ncbi:homeobox-leucine zipper protein ROC5-like [Zingiber officinale]|uniref:Uncharacterized protein n=1 Tax=Zingiber officinale TaxID=94328 RepID=A0A8J5I7K6_ZINOF|nr:homeobox-leucine zipper protein ROC5-like [Zingiber officinale]XP_042459577.1 homeobox-leucine zipper protein ROC5-like [Zingiber officinale]KAG6530271.1 hypothetical protein ZIOFF_012494 [Zingiber officinale]
MRAQSSEEERDRAGEKKEASWKSFGGKAAAAAMTVGKLSPPRLRLSGDAGFISSGLSLGLPMMAGGGGGGSDGDSSKRNREDENESRSGSDNLEAISGDDLDQVNDNNSNSRKKKRYHRHTPQQIQELEALFKECPHPDEKQRHDLSKRLCLETRQVKFWFQNRRTQMKTQIERHENTILRQENDKLRTENMAIREAMCTPVCDNCGSPAVLGEISMEEQQLRIENARLKEELGRVCTLASRFLGKPIDISSLQAPSSMLELGVGMTNSFAVAPSITVFPEYDPLMSSIAPPPLPTMGSDQSLVVDLALAAMDELVAMAQMEEPLWVRSFVEGVAGAETLNHEQYHRNFRRLIMPSPAAYVSEASRETGIVLISSVALVETFMDPDRWAEMFSTIVAKATATEVISSGVAGTRDGALQIMRAELQILSPLVAVREVSFLRFCKQHADGFWAIVDISVDGGLASSSCRRLPSGCLVQDMPNGYSKLIWVEHAEYDEAGVHPMYRSLLRSGLGFGAGRWVAGLHRRCESLRLLMSPAAASGDDTAAAMMAGVGRRRIMKLAQRMTLAFCAGVVRRPAAAAAGEWSAVEQVAVEEAQSAEEAVRVSMRKSVTEAGEPPGVVLSAATAVWLPVVPRRLFDFLSDAGFRCRWDILANGGAVYEMAHVATSANDSVNAVSLLRSSTSQQLILQETCSDAAGATVVYAAVDAPALHHMMNGGDDGFVAILPSGFAILPDAETPAGGSLLTVAFQVSHRTAELTAESLETVNGLVSCTLLKIKAALRCDVH